MKDTFKFMLLLSAILLTACNPKYYTPNTHNVPLLTEKGESNLTICGSANQVEFQGAYGVSDQIAILANGGLFIPKDLENGDGGSGKFLELGSGYFKELSHNFVFETYFLLGMGSLENHLPSTTTANPLTKGKIEANLFRLGLQPNLGYKTKYFSMALSSRLVHISYYKINGDLIYEQVNQSDYLNKHASNFLIEPALTIRGGVEKVKLQIQIGYSFNVSNPDFRQDKSFATVGLNFNFRD